MTLISHAIAGSSALGVSFLVAQNVLAPPPFIEVHQLFVDQDTVFVERSYNVDGTAIADWRVTILGVGADAPACQTISGPEEHEGWSRYSGPQRLFRNMPLDVWVGDPGCFERLDAGEHQMFVTWTPRDGTYPVAAYAEFTIE